MTFSATSFVTSVDMTAGPASSVREEPADKKLLPRDSTLTAGDVGREDWAGGGWRDGEGSGEFEAEGDASCEGAGDVGDLSSTCAPRSAIDS